MGLTPVELNNRIDIIDGNTFSYSPLILNPTNNFETGIKEIDESLLKYWQPILVGVNHTSKFSSNNANLATYHFILIIGKGFDVSKNMYYYRYFDVGCGKLDYAKSINNRLYIDEDNKLIQGQCAMPSHPKWIYTVTEIRPNKH